MSLARARGGRGRRGAGVVGSGFEGSGRVCAGTDAPGSGVGRGPAFSACGAARRLRVSGAAAGPRRARQGGFWSGALEKQATEEGRAGFG